MYPYCNEDFDEVYGARFDNEYSAYHYSFSQGNWANEDAEKCACGGNGWALSEVDTWHQCRIHYHGQRHPEDDSPDPTLKERIQGWIWRFKQWLIKWRMKIYNLLHKDDVPF